MCPEPRQSYDGSPQQHSHDVAAIVMLSRLLCVSRSLHVALRLNASVHVDEPFVDALHRLSCARG
jgi:hypothetical protein